MGQLAHLEEDLLTDLIKSTTEMASKGFRLCRFPRRNLLIDLVEDELARDPGSVGGPHSSGTSPVPSRDPTLGPKLISTLIPAPVPAPAPLFSHELFKQFIKAYLKSNQGLRQPPMEHEQPLKAKIPEMYYGKSNIDCYHFCQQCEDHFKTAGATGTNRTLFAAFFFCGSISV